MHAKTRTIEPHIVYIVRARLHRKRANVIQTLKTVEALEKIGVRVRLFIPPWHKREPLQERLSFFGVFKTLDVHATRLLKSCWKAFSFAPFFWVHDKLLRTVPCVYTRSIPLSLCLARRGIPHSLEIHDVVACRETGMLQPLLLAYQHGIIRNLFPISRAISEILVENGAEPDRIHVCPSGVDTEIFSNIQPINPMRLKNPHILYTGRISRDRGLGILEQLASMRQCRVTVVGEMQDQPRNSAIQVIPFVSHSEIPKYLEEADILVMPYQRHLPHARSISPIKLFEAMAAGRPIIISDLGPIREVIRNGENGLCVNPDDPSAWLAAVDLLRKNPDLAVRLSQVAKKEASKYSWENRAFTIRNVVLNHQLCTKQT